MLELASALFMRGSAFLRNLVLQKDGGYSAAVSFETIGVMVTGVLRLTSHGFWISSTVDWWCRLAPSPTNQHLSLSFIPVVRASYTIVL